MASNNILPDHDYGKQATTNTFDDEEFEIRNNWQSQRNIEIPFYESLALLDKDDPIHTFFLQSPFSIKKFTTPQEKILEEIKYNNKEMVDILLRSVNPECTDYYGNNLIHCAAKSRMRDLIPKLVYLGVDVNAYNFMGQTPLLLATLAQDKKTIKTLLKAQAKLNISDHSGCTAIFYAKDVDILKILLKWESSADYRNEQCDIYHLNKDKDTALHVHLRKGWNASASLLIKESPNISIYNERGETLLHACAQGAG